ncbi:hypothetical protein [Thiohalomonas denitrificans]|uniref:hypothetical protein n=1 Tax=Thiohalomonas denitrificans TaxID=415747 RepID=UPI0026E9F5FD|nr:hypothetical protein [Thiohalomonas denitrificans]
MSSLGNMVASSAIANADFPASRYYMINAAVPIEAYASGQSHGWDGVEMLGRMTEDSWKSYREQDGSDKLFADGWHNLFTDSRK